MPGRAAHPAGAVLLHRIDHAPGRGVVVGESHEHLIQHDVVQHYDTVDRTQLLGESTRVRATVRHDLADTLASQGTQRDVHRNAPAPA